MVASLERRSSVPERSPLLYIGRTPGTGLEDRAIFTLVSGEADAWTVAIRWANHCSPFEGMLVWQQAGCALVGGGDEFYALDLSTGAICGHWDVDGYFGYFAPSPDGTRVFVLGATAVLALSADLAVRWQSPPIAVDGITLVGFSDDRLVVDAELDPPGGWRRVSLRTATGQPDE